MEGGIRRVTSEDAPETEEEVNEDAAELEMKDAMMGDIGWRVANSLTVQVQWTFMRLYTPRPVADSYGSESTTLTGGWGPCAAAKSQGGRSLKRHACEVLLAQHLLLGESLEPSSIGERNTLTETIDCRVP